MRFYHSRTRISVLALLSSVCLGASYATAQGMEFRYWPDRQPKAMAPQGAPAQDESLEIALSLPTLFALTVGEPLSLPLAVNGNTDDVSYRAAEGAVIPGLSVDSSSGTVAGMPDVAAGTVYTIAVEAIRDGSVIGTTVPVERVLRDPIEVVAVPDDINLTAGDPFPMTGLGAQASGGDPESLSWSLENAPDWLEIIDGSNPGFAVLRVKDDTTVGETAPTAVKLVASDAEGREDRSKSFAVTVLPSPSKLLASDGEDEDYFGFSASISNNVMLVGAYGSGITGAAYIFQNSGGDWTELTKLTASDGEFGDQFGASVSISGDTAVIGNPIDDDNGPGSGSVYVFQNSGGAWTEVVKLTATDSAAGDAFGGSVSISDGTVVVGARGDDDNGTRTGSAYVFQNSDGTWTQVAKLTATDGERGDYFGKSVSISDDTVIIGATGGGDNGLVSGSAYVFQNSGGTWTEVAKLTASDASARDGFGNAVSISGDTAVVAAWMDGEYGTGSAYVFQNSNGTWTQVAKLAPADGERGTYFGESVSISDDTVIIGATGDDDNGLSSGSAYVFQNSGGTWKKTGKLLASDGTARDHFGASVLISGDTAAVGAPHDGDYDNKPGSVYVFPIP